MICTKFGSSPLWPCCSCTAGLLTTPVGIQSGALLNLIFRQRHPPAVPPPTRSFSHTQHPLLSHPRLPQAHSDILRWDTAAVWTESSASWTGLGTLGSLKKGTHGVRQLQACRLPAHQAQRPHQHLEKTSPDLNTEPACCLSAGQVKGQDEAGPCWRPPFGGCHQGPPLRECLAGSLPALR